MCRVLSLSPTNPKHLMPSRKYAHSKSATSQRSSLPARLPPLDPERNGTPAWPPARHFPERKSSSFNSLISTLVGRLSPKRKCKFCESPGVRFSQDQTARRQQSPDAHFLRLLRLSCLFPL